VVGAGGAGMSAIADVLARMGHRVSGSDLKPSANLERLRGLGVRVHIGHDLSLVADVDAVAISTAVPARDPEVRAAREAGTIVLSRATAASAGWSRRSTASWPRRRASRS
jgi:UDP-N-acetylmuramate--alanine ligase